MRMVSGLVRSGEANSLPRVFVPVDVRHRGRPPTLYRLRADTEKDVEAARRHGLPLFLLTPEWVTAHGYPEHFRPLLFVWEGLAGKVSSSAYSRVLVRDRDALRSPGFEEVLTFLLKVDMLAARELARRNAGKFDPNELYRRVRNEGMEERATKVRLQEFVPGLPKVGEPFPKDELDWADRNVPATSEVR
ncbi:MAG TPA: hypothetical protein VGG32_08855 [Thermoplasmata archaeon]|jgi:hypothetical protein